MSAPKRRLGRGLDVLLGERRPPAVEPGEAPRVPPTGAGAIAADPAAPAETLAGGLLEIAVAAIRPNPQQPRQVFDAADLAELEQSVREFGVLVPVLVRRLPTTANGSVAYELVAGERRWRAAAAARLATIPAIVRAVDDKTSLEIAIVENLQRRDLDPLEEAMGFQHLLDDYAFTQEQVAERVGKSRSAVTNALRLLGLSDAIKGRLRAGALSAGHARALLALDANARDAVADRVEREGLSVRAVERLGERRDRPARATAAKSPDVEAVEARLRYRLGAPVAIVAGGNGGKIEIRYASPADLIRLVEALGGDVA